MSSTPRRHRIGLTPARTARVGAVVFTSLLVSGIIMERSSSAFTASTGGREGNWTAGNMALTASGPAELNILSMVPGDSTTECIDVTYTGTVPQEKLTEVRLRSDGSGVTGDLAPALDLTVDMGASCDNMGQTSSVATGKLSELGAASTFDKGYSTDWKPENGESRGFRITVSLPHSVNNNDSQGDAASAHFAWEVQSTPSSS